MAAFGSPHLRYEKRDGVAWLWIDRPEARNALTRAMYAGLGRACEEGDRDPDVQITVITGTGDVFCSGGDIKESQRFLETLESDTAPVLFGDTPNAYMPADPIRAIQKAKKIVVAAVNGLCLGGGFMTAMTSDICVASENASFCVPEARLGLIDAWVAYRLPLYVGLERAKQIILTCRPFDAASAARWGMISAVVPRGELESYVTELAADICASGPEARQAYKALANRHLPDDDEMAIHYSTANAVWRTANSREGIRAFEEKRPPVWVRDALPAPLTFGS
jgi:enoyl-CoA hydratase